MVVIMDIASGEWTSDGLPAVPPAVPDAVPRAAMIEARLALQELSTTLPRQTRIPYNFPPPSDLPQLLTCR